MLPLPMTQQGQYLTPVTLWLQSQSGNMLLAMNVWNYVMENDVSILGDVNPNNAAIHAKFGDQGGEFALPLSRCTACTTGRNGLCHLAGYIN